MLAATEMDLSVFIAKITALVYLSAALGAICSANHYRKLLDDMFKNAGLSYLMGFTAVIVGCLIVNYHNIWEANWTVLITLLGWLALIKGVLIIALPGFVQRFSDLMFKGWGFKIFPYAAILVGLLFGYFGFVLGSGGQVAAVKLTRLPVFQTRFLRSWSLASERRLNLVRQSREL